MIRAIAGHPLQIIVLWGVLLVTLPASHPASATSVGVLPAWVCAHPDALFVDGFQPTQSITRLPSNGSGGAVGSISRSVSVPGYGTHTVYLSVPASYSPAHPVPLVLALHGQAGPGQGDAAAQTARNTWAPVASANGFIVVAPVGTEALGGWVPPPPNPSDYDIFAAAIADAEAAYNIDRSRRIGWGFSAGGHVMYDIVFNDFGAPLSIDTFAAFAVSAGAMSSFACSSEAECNAIVAAAPRHIPIDIHVGNGDSLATPAIDDYNRFRDHGWVRYSDLWFTLFVGIHNYSTAQLGEIWTHLCPFQALP